MDFSSCWLKQQHHRIQLSCDQNHETTAGLTSLKRELDSPVNQSNDSVLQCAFKFAQYRFNAVPLGLLCFGLFKSSQQENAPTSVRGMREASHGQTLIISLTGEMHANTTENYKDISSGIISYSYSSFPVFFFVFFGNLYVWLCVCVFMRIWQI